MSGINKYELISENDLPFTILFNLDEQLLYINELGKKKYGIGEFESCIKNESYNEACGEGLECTHVPTECGVNKDRHICMKKK